MVIALAGRRVDAPNAAVERFPEKNLDRVRDEIASFLVTTGAKALVCAAVCGADIIALEQAALLGLRRRIVLPYDRRAFKTSSVIDRPGDWGDRYDRIVAEVDALGDLIEYRHDQENDETYFATNNDILNQAAELGAELETETAALVVWNGESRGADDVTGHFREEAKRRGMPVTGIITV